MPPPSEVKKIPVDLIDRSPYQPRSEIYAETKESRKKILDLEASMKRVGLLQSLMVRPTENERFELISGHMRLKAAKTLKWENIRCGIYTGVPEATIMYVVFTDNVARDQLKPYELGKFFRRCMEMNVKIERLSELFPYDPQEIRRYVGLAAAVDKLMTGFSEQEQGRIINDMYDSTLKLLITLSEASPAGEAYAGRIIRQFLEQKKPELEVSMDARIRTAINTIGANSSENKPSNNKPKPKPLDASLLDDLKKLKKAEKSSEIASIANKLEKDYQKTIEQNEELKELATRYSTITKAAKEFRIAGEKVKITHEIDRDKGILRCIHIVGKKSVCLEFKLKI